MGLFFKKRSKSKKKYLLALDIGTEFVKSLVVEIDKEQGLVIGVGRQRQLVNNMRAGAVADIDGVTLICREAIEQSVQMARIRPNRAIIGIAGEFIKGATTNFIYQRSNPEEKIDLAEIKNIIQKIQWRAFDKIRSQLSLETGQPEIEIRLINALIPEIRIDGYEVTNPLDFQGKEVFLSIFNIYAPLVHLSALENIAYKLGLKLLSIVAEPYALTKSSSFNPRSGAIFIDIGGGTTDIALVRQGRVEGIKSFALAGRTFTKRLCQALDLGLDEAEEIKIKHANKQFSQNVQRKIGEIIKRDIEIWLNGVELILEEFNQAHPRKDSKTEYVEFFPSLILLYGGGSLLPGIRNILKKEIVQNQWLNKFPFDNPLQIKFIRSNQIDNITDQTGILKGPENITPLALANLALELAVDEKKILSPILRRVIRMMR
ncbi:MAG: rod shape-determining protein [Parcubacteria group bacterium]|nr:rod shape-determining protein [Parcubacteria group bacterium]